MNKKKYDKPDSTMFLACSACNRWTDHRLVVDFGANALYADEIGHLLAFRMRLSDKDVGVVRKRKV